MYTLDSTGLLKTKILVECSINLGKIGCHKTTCCTKQPAVQNNLLFKTTCCTKQPAISDVQQVVLCEPIFAIFIEKLCMKVWNFYIQLTNIISLLCNHGQVFHELHCRKNESVIGSCQVDHTAYISIPRPTMTLGCVLWRQWSRLLATSRETTLIWTR